MALTIAQARKAATEKRLKREAEEAAEAAASTPEKPAKTPEPSGIIAAIRKAFSSADDIDRIDKAVDAVTQGVSDADKRKDD